jgi:hypothetical protein
MKNIMCNFLNYNKLFLILFLALTISLTLSFDSNAQGKRIGGGRTSGRGFVHSQHRMGGFAGIHHGYFFRPQIGARIRVLPLGFTSFWFVGLEYYYWDGTYYRYLPAEAVYVVENNPAGADNKDANLKFDQAQLYDGSILEGTFEGATDSTITFRIGSKDQDIKSVI